MMNAVAEWLGGLMGNALAMVFVVLGWILAWLIVLGLLDRSRPD
jgi:flagellar biosynthesis protein FliR